MDADTDIHFMRSETSQNSLASIFTTDHERVPDSNTTPGEDSVSDTLPPPNAHSSLVTDGGGIEAHRGESQIHPLKSDEESSDIQTERNRIDHEYIRVYPQSNPNQTNLLVIPEEVSASECVAVPIGQPTSLISTSDTEAPTNVYPQESRSSRASTVSSETPLHDEKESGADDRLNPTQMLDTGLDHAQSPGLACLARKEGTRDCPDEDFVSSLPPSSSPSQLFSSSPYASSQSSVGAVESSKMILVVEVEGCASSRDYAHGDVVPVAQEDSRLEFGSLYMGLTSGIENGLELSKKRSADPDESHDSRPIKRPKPDPLIYLPPEPKRTTLVSRDYQFKKLAAPFRSPLKLSVVTDGLAQTANSRKFEPTTSATLEASHNKIDRKRSTIPLRNKASNTSRSVTQFKSPLVNGVLPAGSRSIRLTPALQALERKLQLLKRAIKVKEENEEEVLTELTEKWIEAGREVAYDVWDATKDTDDFTGKATFIRRSHGWVNTNDGHTPWGWDTKPGDTGEESCDPDPSEAPCVAGRLTLEEDNDDADCNTLGTMLRQLGIAPEILGWDDEKEAFSD